MAKITLENFGPNNRERQIGNSLYRVCIDSRTKQWYLFEIYNDGFGFTYAKSFYTYDLGKLLEALDGFSGEREVIGQCSAQAAEWPPGSHCHYEARMPKEWAGNIHQSERRGNYEAVLYF